MPSTPITPNIKLTTHAFLRVCNCCGAEDGTIQQLVLGWADAGAPSQGLASMGGATSVALCQACRRRAAVVLGIPEGRIAVGATVFLDGVDSTVGTVVGEDDRHPQVDARIVRVRWHDTGEIGYFWTDRLTVVPLAPGTAGAAAGAADSPLPKRTAEAEIAANARAQRLASATKVNELCACEWPLKVMRNLSGHASTCPAHAYIINKRAERKLPHDERGWEPE